MNKDALDKSTSIGAELTPTGLNVKAKSRLVAAIDRLGGNAVDAINIPLERRNSRERAKIEGEQQLIEAVTRIAIERMGIDDEFAERVTRNLLGSAFARQDNKDGVMRHLIEDLRRDPVADEGSEQLDPLFVNKIERHAEDAATEQLREKWGRVVAAEIRRPGTVTPMVLRVVDEMDAETAQIFEELCSNRLSNVIPTCLAGALDFRRTVKLVSAGLLVDPSPNGQIRHAAEAEDQRGSKLLLFDLGIRGLGIPVDAKVNALAGDEGKIAPMVLVRGGVAIPVYVLTDAGLAVSRILPDHEANALKAYVKKLSAFAADLPISIFEGDGTTWLPSDLPQA